MPKGIYIRTNENKKNIGESRKKLIEEGKITVWNKGLTKETDDSMKHISELRKGKHPSEETRRKMSVSRNGKKLSEETKDKMSKVHKGRYTGKSWEERYGVEKAKIMKKKSSLNQIGKIMSEESRIKMSNSKKGISPKNINSIKGWNKGNRSGENIECKNCGKEKYFTNSMINKNSKGNFFCSSPCQWEYSKGNNHPMFGKKHTKESLEKMKESSINMWNKEGYREKVFNSIHKGISKEDIINKFSEGMTLKEISNYYSFSIETIRNILHQAGIKKTNINSRKHLSELRKNNWEDENYRNLQLQKMEKMYKIWRDNPELSPSWKGGVSFEPYDIKWNNLFRKQIRKRDNQVCMNCGIHREKLKRALSVHHINYDKLLTIPENCISLCIKCHGLTMNNREYWIKFLQSILHERYNYNYTELNEPIIEINQGIK